MRNSHIVVLIACCIFWLGPVRATFASERISSYHTSKQEKTSPFHQALQTSVQTVSNDIFVLTISLDSLNDIGTYTIATGPKYPYHDNFDMLFGGSTRTPWSSYLTVRSYTTKTDYITRRSNATPDIVPTNGYTPVFLNTYGTVYNSEVPLGFVTRWEVIPDAVARDELEIIQETYIEGNPRVDDTRLRITVHVRNTGNNPVDIGIRNMFDYEINNNSTPPFAEHVPDKPFIRTYNEWFTPRMLFYEVADDEFEPSLRVFGSVNGPFFPIPATPPNKIQYASWSNLFAHDFDVIIGDTTSDNAVAHYWGDNINNAITIPPGGEYVATMYLYSRDLSYVDLIVENKTHDTVIVGDTLKFVLMVISPFVNNNVCVGNATAQPGFVSLEGRCGFSPVLDTVTVAPQGSDTGYYVLSFQGTEGSLIDIEDMGITVLTPPGLLPMFTTQLSDTTITEGDSLQFDIAAVDPDTSGPLSFSMLSPSARASLVDYHDGTARFTFVPDFRDVDSSYRFIISVTDGRNIVSDSMMIYVTNRQLLFLGAVYSPNSTDFLISDPIPLSFNEAVNSSSLLGNVTVSSAVGQPLTYTYEPGSTTFYVYPPSQLDFTPLDTITIQVSGAILDMAGYPLGATETIAVLTSPVVYPGETDNNGIVDERDILPLGIFWGDTGPVRDTTGGVEWYATPAHRWEQLRATYADADGNGIVDADDICTIAANWGNMIITPFSSQQDSMGTNINSYQLSPALKQLNNTVLSQMYEALIDCSNTGAGRAHLLDMFAAMLNDIPRETLPSEMEVYQNYPNPFNPTTTIRYYLPHASLVHLAIYNIVGQEVTVLVDGIVEAGFDEVVWDADGLSSGMYFYRLQTDEKTITKRMLLLK